MWEQLIHSRGGGEETLSADQVQRERQSNHARGAHVRSLGAVVLNGLSICDHPNVGSLLWWAHGVPARRAQRAGMSLAAWAAANNLVPPAAAVAAAVAAAGGGAAGGGAGAAVGAAGPAVAGPAVAAAAAGDDNDA